MIQRLLQQGYLMYKPVSTSSLSDFPLNFDFYTPSFSTGTTTGTPTGTPTGEQYSYKVNIVGASFKFTINGDDTVSQDDKDFLMSYIYYKHEVIDKYSII